MHKIDRIELSLRDILQFKKPKEYDDRFTASLKGKLRYLGWFYDETRLEYLYRHLSNTEFAEMRLDLYGSIADDRTINMLEDSRYRVFASTWWSAEYLSSTIATPKPELNHELYRNKWLEGFKEIMSHCTFAVLQT